MFECKHIKYVQTHWQGKGAVFYMCFCCNLLIPSDKTSTLYIIMRTRQSVRPQDFLIDSRYFIRFGLKVILVYIGDSEIAHLTYSTVRRNSENTFGIRKSPSLPPSLPPFSGDKYLTLAKCSTLYFKIKVIDTTRCDNIQTFKRFLLFLNKKI